MADREAIPARSMPGGVRWAIYGLVALLVSAAASTVAAMPSRQFDVAGVPGAISVPPPVAGAPTTPRALPAAPSSAGQAAPAPTPPVPSEQPAEQDNQPKGYWPSELGEQNRSGLYTVTLKTVEDPVAGVPGFPAPQPGTRLVAAEFTVENGFDHAIRVIRIQATDMDAYPSGTVLEVDWGRPGLTGTVPAGETQRGWALFEVSTDISHFVAAITTNEGQANTIFRFSV